jgi:MYXO-CTERM domain-containing protein
MRTSLFSLVVACAAAFAALVQLPGRALAGPVEQLAQLVLHPTNPDVMVLRYVNGGHGLLYSADGGVSFKLLCLSSIERDPPIRAIGTIALAGDGRVVMGLFDGLLLDEGGGCGFADEPSLADKWITELVVDPSDPQALYVATSKTASGGGAEPNGIYRRDADGQFAQYGTLEALLITRMRVVPMGAGQRIYQSAIHGTTSGMVSGMMVDDLPNYVIRVSDDGAQTFTEFPYGSGNGSAFRLVGADPINPDRIVAVLDHTQEDDELFLSTDRGETFVPYHSLSQLAAVEILPDGRVFLGEAASSTDPQASVGLWAAASLDEAPVKLADYPTQCLAYQAATDTLFACQRWAFGTVDMSDGAFTERMKFTTIEEFVACDGVDMADTCEMQMCGDYCGLGHFAQAGICEVYTGPFCGPCAAAMETDEPPLPECEMVTAGTGGGGSGGTQDAGMEAGSGAAGEDTPPRAGEGGASGSGGSGGTAGEDDDDGGGCSCSVPGRAAGARPAAWAAGLLLALAWVTRRRRARG